MGNLDLDPAIKHFSHHHILHLQNNQSQHFLSLSCGACKKQASGLIYACDICKYCLHKTCSSLRRTYEHRVDVKHPLTLLSAPAYPEGVFRCNACGSNGTGFCYHCGYCEIDIHTVCAFMPYEIQSPSHNHPLQLCFDPPYDDGGFSCDVCGKSGSNHWLYRCDSCQFDSHMKCAKNPPQAQNVRTISGSQPQLVTSRSVRGQQFQPPPPPAAVSAPPCSCGGRQSGGFHYGQGNVYGSGSGYGHGQPQKSNSGLRGRVVEGIMEGIANQAGQALFQALTD